MSSIERTEYEKGHWYSFFRDRLVGTVPPIQMLIQTQYKSNDVVLPQEVPAYKGFPPRFIFRLLGAKLAMILKL